MRNAKEVLEDKKFILIINLIKILHREHLELARIMLMYMLKPDTYKESFPKLEADWDNIIESTISEGLKVRDEDFKHD